MANIDVPIKRLMQSTIGDWVKLLVPGCDEDWVKEMDPSKVPAKKESRLDKLVLIDSPDERFILNIEPQGYLDYKMPARMLRYRADIWEYTMDIGLDMPSIKQAVMTILAGEKFTSELITKYVRREMIMGSPLYKEWVEDEIKEANFATAIRTTKANILGALEAKFDFIPKPIKETIEGINDIDTLDRLRNRAVLAVSMEAFEEILNKAKIIS